MFAGSVLNSVSSLWRRRLRRRVPRARTRHGGSRPGEGGLAAADEQGGDKSYKSYNSYKSYKGGGAETGYKIYKIYKIYTIYRNYAIYATYQSYCWKCERKYVNL